MSSASYAVNIDRRVVSPIVEDLLEQAVWAARTIAHNPAQTAAALEATLWAADLLDQTNIR